jgi:hypothetical protein
MTDRALDAYCHDCGGELALELYGERAVRCPECFEDYLRALDLEFLDSYGQLGVTSRRVVAETCLRGLVLEMPPARKVLAMAIMEQFFLASGDLIGLTHALRERHRAPIVRTFLSFQLDAAASEAFFAELQDADGNLLESFGLPEPELVSRKYPAIEPKEARELSAALTALVRDLRSTGERASSALLLSDLAASVRAGPSLTATSSWLQNGSGQALRGDQVASLVLDERRRQLVVQAVSVDEDRLGSVVDAIDCMTRAASNLIYSYLTVQDEEDRLGEQRRGKR